MRTLCHSRLLWLARRVQLTTWQPTSGENPPPSTGLARSFACFSVRHDKERPNYRRGAVGDGATAPSGNEHGPLVAVISPMPEELVSNSPPSGVALYTSRLLVAYDGDWVVAALGQTSSRSVSSTPRLAVLPTWRPGWRGVWDIFGELRRLHPRVIHAQHELRLYGGIMPTFTLIMCLNWFRWRGARIVTTLHGVPHPNDIESQNILPQLPGSRRLAKPLMLLYFRLVLATCDAVAVLSPVFRQRLLTMFPSQSAKVHVIPLGVDAKRVPSGCSTKGGRASRPHAIAFGFLTSYKSPELIVDACEQGLLDDFQVTLSVARNPRATSAQMEARYHALYARASRLPQITWRQYLSDAELADLLRQADVVILPYTACVASSAVAALAEDARVPVAYSTPLEELFGKTRASFALTPQALASAVRAVVYEGIVVRTPHSPWREVAAATFALWQGA